METTKQGFKFNEELRVWISFPFIITDKQYNEMDWSEFDAFLENFNKERIEIENKSNDALVMYAKGINFFSDEEINDLKFKLFDVKPNIDNGIIQGFNLSYGVDEDENSKIHWKDVYGIWKVEFLENKIVNVIRE